MTIWIVYLRREVNISLWLCHILLLTNKFTGISAVSVERYAVSKDTFNENYQRISPLTSVNFG